MGKLPFEEIQILKQSFKTDFKKVFLKILKGQRISIIHKTRKRNCDIQTDVF